jgi:EXLDI family protein
VAYDAGVPNKTIYVSDDDLPLFKRAQELIGGNLSAAITTALRRYVEVEEGRQEGYEEIVVRVGVGRGRKQRFVGVLLGEWSRMVKSRQETFRVYRSRTGKFVVNVERSDEWKDNSSEKWQTGWRSWIGDWSANQWGFVRGESTLHIVDSLDELRELLPDELYELVEGLADQPPVEDLDI